MKLTSLFLLLLTNVFFVQAQESLDTTSTSIELISFEGVGDVKVYKTTLKDLKAKYPDCKVERYREQIGFGFSDAARSVSLEDQGIYFLLERKKTFGQFYVRTIIMDSTFTGKTITGVGIESTYNEIVSEFGENRILGLNSKYEKVSTLYYDKSPASITFKCYNTKADTNTFKVEQIMIWGWDEEW